MERCPRAPVAADRHRGIFARPCRARRALSAARAARSDDPADHARATSSSSATRRTMSCRLDSASWSAPECSPNARACRSCSLSRSRSSSACSTGSQSCSCSWSARSRAMRPAGSTTWSASRWWCSASRPSRSSRARTRRDLWSPRHHVSATSSDRARTTASCRSHRASRTRVRACAIRRTRCCSCSTASSCGRWKPGLFIALLPIFGLPQNIAWGVVAMGVTNLGLLVPSSPGFIGPFHYFCSRAIMAHGVDEPTALAYATLVHLAFYVPVTVWGASAMLWYGVEVGSTAAIAREARRGDKLTTIRDIPLVEIAPVQHPPPEPNASAFTIGLVEAIVGDSPKPAAVTYAATFVDGQIAALAGAVARDVRRRHDVLPRSSRDCDSFAATVTSRSRSGARGRRDGRRAGSRCCASCSSRCARRRSSRTSTTTTSSASFSGSCG